MEGFLSDFLLVGQSPRRFHPKDPFRTFSWRSINIISEISKNEAFYVLRTNVRISRFQESMKLMYFLQGLDLGETQAILSLPGVLDDRIFVDLLRAKMTLLSEGNDPDTTIQVLLGRVNRLRSLLGFSEWNFHLLNTYFGNLKYELFQTEKRIRKFKKYSGYIKTPSAAGAKRMSLQELPLELESTYEGEFYEREFYSYFISPNEDFSLLGFNARSLYTQTLMKYLKEGKELPDHSKHLVFWELR